MLPVAVAQFFSDGSPIHYAHPILWMMSCFHIMEPRWNWCCARCRFCVGDRYYLLGVRILCEVDYEQHLRQFGDQLQQSVSMTTQLPPDSETMTSPSTSDASPWYEPSRQLVPGRRFYSSAENHTLVDDRSSGYGSPSPPCVWASSLRRVGSFWMAAATGLYWIIGATTMGTRGRLPTFELGGPRSRWPPTFSSCELQNSVEH